MRYICKEDPPKLVEGDTRVISKFLWLPKGIGKEIRWLESAEFLETVIRLGQMPPPNSTHGFLTYPRWVATKWYN